MLPVRHTPKLIVISIIVAITARIIFVQNGLDPADILTCLDIFAYGAIAAYLLIKYGERLEKWVNSIPKVIQAVYVVLLVLTVVVFAHNCGLVFKPILFGLLFSFLLVLTFPANAFIKISERNIFSRLGVYAYGIFAFHIFVIIACKKVFEYYSLPLDNGLVAIFFSILTFLLTIVCAALSYKYYERPFLKLKKYFRR
jgi:peptidoglycan/LPS O-acetylase OafA/YrhL